MRTKFIYTIVTANGDTVAKYPATDSYSTAEAYRNDWYKQCGVPVEIKATRVEMSIEAYVDELISQGYTREEVMDAFKEVLKIMSENDQAPTKKTKAR